MSNTLEIVRRIYDDSFGACIEVGPNGEIPGLVMIRTPDEESKKYWGNIEFSVDADFAELLGKSLLAAALEAKGEKA